MTLVGLECLPTELYLQILFSVTDIASLGSLLRASPTAYRLFDDCAVEITEAVLTTGNIFGAGYTCGHIRVVFRIIALIRSGRLPIASLREFQDRVLDESMRYRYRVRESRSGLAPLRLDSRTPPAVLKSILATTRYIQALAHECLSMALTRFNAIEAEHLVDEFDSVHADNPLLFWLNSRPATIKLDAQNSGAPDWGEEQRATRACWRLQLIYDLKRAAEKGLLAWSEADLLELRRKAAIVHPNIKPKDRHCGLTTHSLYNCHQQYWIGDPDHPNPPEFEEIVTIIEHIRNKYGNNCAEKVANGNLSCKSLIGHREIQCQWPLLGPYQGDKWMSIIAASYGAAIYYWSRIFCMKKENGLWVRVVRFDPYRQLGFAFWGEERLVQHGFCRFGKKRSVIPHPFAWFSILDAEELGRVKREIAD